MNIYNYHPIDKVFLGISQADPDPLQEGNWLIPACATTVAPPTEYGVDEHPVWTGSAWVIQKIPSPPQPPEPPAPPEMSTEDKRRLSYTAESDPLFFKWQRGEGTQEAWLAKVNEIKARYP